MQISKSFNSKMDIQMFPLLMIAFFTFVHAASIPRLELVFRPGSNRTVTVWCSDFTTGIVNSKVWLNRTSPSDPGLRERSDVQVIQSNDTHITFILTPELEGSYTCGNSTETVAALESEPKELISFLNNNVYASPSKDIQTTFYATSGDEVALPCPIKPGALLRYYSVTWEKDDNVIADLDKTDSGYTIDRSNFSLIINSVKVCDSSKNYKCYVLVQNPLTDTNHYVSTFNGIVPLNLYVTGKPIISPKSIAMTTQEENTTFVCTVDYTSPDHLLAPNITWTYSINNGATELEITEESFVNNDFQRGDETFTRQSTVTLDLISLGLQMVTNDGAKISCKVGQAVAMATLFMNAQEPLAKTASTGCTCN